MEGVDTAATVAMACGTDPMRAAWGLEVGQLGQLGQLGLGEKNGRVLEVGIAMESHFFGDTP